MVIRNKVKNRSEMRGFKKNRKRGGEGRTNRLHTYWLIHKEMTQQSSMQKCNNAISVQSV